MRRSTYPGNLERGMNILSSKEEIELRQRALNIRKKIVRMIRAGSGGHVGGAMSSVEIVTALYFHLMNSDPKNPKMRERGRFVLSAGHKCLVLYAALAEKGYFDESILDTYGGLGSRLPGHPDMHKLPGVETNTGALGHGLSIAGGMALGLKLDGLESRVFVLMGDGELEEGSNWEAAAACSHYQLDNILVFVDRNSLQISGPTADVMNYEPLKERWEAFGWSVREVDGHNISEIVANAIEIPFKEASPSVILANTVKGKGLSFAEDKVGYHFWNATSEELEIADADLEKAESELLR
jgi:transketolase